MITLARKVPQPGWRARLHSCFNRSRQDHPSSFRVSTASDRSVLKPPRGARQVMEETPHVMLVGDGAEQLARELGLDDPVRAAAAAAAATDLCRAAATLA